MTERTVLTPEQIATDALTGYAPGRDISREDVWSLVRDAIAGDREVRQLPKLVVATPDGRVRTAVVESNIVGLLEVIDGYLDDGYTPEELIIEGVTR